MRLRRYHALGNDYLVLEEAGPALHKDLVVHLCDRHVGIGSDGILEPLPLVAGAYGLRIWNPDGSLAEKSGNGLRIYARWLVEHRGANLDLRVDLPRDVVLCQVRGQPGSGRQVRVEMGRPHFAPGDIPCLVVLLDTPVDVLGRLLHLTAVGLGNPHCVVRVDEPLDSLPWRVWGAHLERLPLFPNRSNVQFVRVITPERVEARIWERGAGETMASGSSATAIVAVGRRLGWLAPLVHVEMPGGTLLVEEDAAGGLLLEGPVDEVGAVTLAPELVALLQRLPRPSARPSSLE